MNTEFFQFSKYGEPSEVLSWKEGELLAPEPGQAIVQLTAIGMNRSELNYTRGKYIPAKSFPSALGQEAVGKIVALGEPVSDGPQPKKTTPLKVGARVALLPGRVDMHGVGTYRTVGIYSQAALAPIPDHFSDEEGAAYWMGVLTMGGCLERAGVTPDNATGKRILITAATSSMGVIALKLAKAWGAQTIATSRSVSKASELEALGVANHVIVCDDSESLIAGVNNVIDNKGFDVALDPVGTAFYPGLTATAAHGASIVSYEMLSGPSLTVSAPQLLVKDITVRGFTIFRVYSQPGLLETLIEQGMKYSNQVRPIIAKTFALKDAPAALEEMGAANHIGKLILQP